MGWKIDDDSLGNKTTLDHSRIQFENDLLNSKVNDPVFYKLSQTHEVYSMKTMLINQIETNSNLIQSFDISNKQ